MTEVVIVCASQESNQDNTLLGRSYHKGRSYETCMYDIHYALDFVANNKQGLAELYNSKIDEYSDVDYIVFAHDDISIEDVEVYQKVVKAIGDDSEYAICGVAGNSKCKVGEKNLWHLMGDRDSMSGAVAHYTGKDDTECSMTNFGVTPKRVVMLDGVFLAINVKKVREAGVRFDESYPSKFHFYDIDFCLEANKAGLKMTTYPIWIVHKSHGLSDINNKEWANGNKYFYNKWKTR